MPPRFPSVTVITGDPRLPDATKVGHRFSREDLESVERMREALASLPGYRFSFLDDHGSLLADLAADPPDFVLNLCDTGFGNDASRELHVPALLELLDVPYSGSPPGALALCFDKGHVRAIADRHGIPVPGETYLPAGSGRLPAGYPALLKPAVGDGSFGITSEAVVRDEDEARRYLGVLAAGSPGRAVLAQEYLPGREIQLALVGNPGQGWAALPPLAVDFSALPAGLPPILSYESKTVPESPYWTDITFAPASLDPPLDAELRGRCEELFALLGCRDYARFDFRADAGGELKLLEVNPNPAWCWDGKLAMMAGFAGLAYADLLGLLLETAQRRAAAGPPL